MGSAVFNVLFVIAVCAIFSKEILELTWYPLARDSTYYLISLGAVAAMFKGPWSPSEIHLWEACALFFMYVMYVVLMKFSAGIQEKLEAKYGGGKSDVQEVGGEAGEAYNLERTISKNSRVSERLNSKEVKGDPEKGLLTAKADQKVDALGLQYETKLKANSLLEI